MNVLVAYASKYGSTKQIAERIALELTRSGRTAEAAPLTAALDIGKYDAFVIGSAVFYGKWMQAAVDFVRNNAGLIKGRPVWLFSSGPLGGVMKEHGSAIPVEVPELERIVLSRGHRVFSGRLERHTLGRLDGFIANVMGIQGDFRDWNDIAGWSGEIAHELEEVAV